MATIECHFRWCPHHEATRLDPGVSGPFCNVDGCTATPAALDEYARRRNLDVRRLRFLPARRHTDRGLWWP